MLLLFKFAQPNYHLFGKELFIRYTVHVFHVMTVYQFCVCVWSFSFGFKWGTLWHLIVLLPDHCLSIYFDCLQCSASQNLSQEFMSRI